MKLDTVITKFLKKKKAMRSDGTYAFYRDHTKALAKYFTANELEELEDITEDDVLDFISTSKAMGYSTKTINTRLDIIKQMIKQNILDKDLTLDQQNIIALNQLKVESRSYMPLNKAQVKYFCKWVSSLKNNRKEIKKKCIFLICIQNGIRLEELRQLKVSDLMLYSNRIKLTHTKINGARYAYFNDETRDTLEKYLELFKPQNFLFENDKTHEALGKQGLTDLFRVASKHMPGQFKVTSHIIRATFATHALRNGCNIESVRIMMGHKYLTTTQIYLHMTDEEILNDNQQFNPLAVYEQGKLTESNEESKEVED